MEELELGTLLQKARKNKGLTLDQIQEETKIRKKYLEAIENNDFDVLPGAVYLKVFVKGYARIVDLNYQALLDNYPVLHQVEEKEKSVSQDYLSSKSIRRRNGKYKSLKNIFKWVFFIFLGLVLILGAVFAYQYFTNAELRLLNQEQIEESINNQPGEQEEINSGSESSNAGDETEEAEQTEENAAQEVLTGEENQQDPVNTAVENEAAESEPALNQISENNTIENTAEQTEADEIAEEDAEEVISEENEENEAEQSAVDNSENNITEDTAATQEESLNSQNAENLTTENNSQTENSLENDQQSNNNNQNEENADEVDDSQDSREENISSEDEISEQQDVQAEAVREITINNSERVWLSVSADGENVYSNILEVEEDLNFEFEDRLYMKIGLARAVTVNLNGREYGPFQGEAEIAEVEFLLRDNEIIFNNLRTQ